MAESSMKPSILKRIFKRKDYVPVPDDSSSKTDNWRAFKTVTTSVSQDPHYFIPPPPPRYSESLGYRTSSQIPLLTPSTVERSNEKEADTSAESAEVYPAGVHSIELEQLRNVHKWYLREYDTTQKAILTYICCFLYYFYYDPYTIIKALFFGAVILYCAQYHLFMLPETRKLVLSYEMKKLERIPEDSNNPSI